MARRVFEHRSSLIVSHAMLIVVFGATVEIGPADDLVVAVGALRPGDELVLRSGTYQLTARTELAPMGTASAPIVLRAQVPGRATITRAGTGENVLDLGGAYWSLRDLEVSGGSTGLRFLAGAHHITVANCSVHDTDGNGIRLTDNQTTYDAFRLVGNVIARTGASAINLGCSSASCRVSNSVVEGNYVHHAAESAIEVRVTSYGNVIRDNVIHDAALVGIALYSAGDRPDLPNVVERNAIWRVGDNGIQATRDAIIRNNVILGAANNGIELTPNAAVMGGIQEVSVLHNTVLDADGTALAIRTVGGPVVVANNALFSSTGAALTTGGQASLTLSRNFGSGSAQLTAASLSELRAASFSGEPPNDVFPSASSVLARAGDPAHAVADDFNGTARVSPPTVGAYEPSPDGNTGWTIAAMLKPAPRMAVPDAGTQTDGGPSSDGGLDGTRRPYVVGCGCDSGAPTLAFFVLALALRATRGGTCTSRNRARGARAQRECSSPYR